MNRAIQVLELARPMVKASPFFGYTFEGCVETALQICKVVGVRLPPYIKIFKKPLLAGSQGMNDNRAGLNELTEEATMLIAVITKTYRSPPSDPDISYSEGAAEELRACVSFVCDYGLSLT
jgi:hypothetical protein